MDLINKMFEYVMNEISCKLSSGEKMRDNCGWDFYMITGKKDIENSGMTDLQYEDKLTRAFIDVPCFVDAYVTEHDEIQSLRCVHVLFANHDNINCLSSYLYGRYAEGGRDTQ
jgi:hypothetical protein